MNEEVNSPLITATVAVAAAIASAIVKEELEREREAIKKAKQGKSARFSEDHLNNNFSDEQFDIISVR